MPKRLIVVDGPDVGRHFQLPDSGVQMMGNSRRNCDICLHDLIASRVHCELEFDDGRVVVTDQDDSSGTFLNGQKVRQEELHLGDVLRVGNSYLRLEEGVASDRETVDDADVVEDVDVIEEAEEVEEEAVVELAELPHLAPDQLAELSGYTLAHYDVGPVLGKGHCGVVFQAHNTKENKQVALKVLSPDFPKNDDEMQRFVRTLKVGLSLRHPNLVAALGAGKTGHYTWIALEHVEGENLAEMIDRFSKKPKIDWKRALRVATHLGRALELGHRHNLVHRNITPRNILWQTEEKIAKLNDLALARALQGSLVRQLAVREKLQDELVYLAPEQTNSPAYVDGLSDLYSLGVAVYSLATGKPLFEADKPADLVRQIRGTKPVRPTKFQSHIPEAFEHTILKMLAKRQEDRYQNATELLADLEEIAEDEEVAVP